MNTGAKPGEFIAAIDGVGSSERTILSAARDAARRAMVDRIASTDKPMTDDGESVGGKCPTLKVTSFVDLKRVFEALVDEGIVQNMEGNTAHFTRHLFREGVANPTASYIGAETDGKTKSDKILRVIKRLAEQLRPAQKDQLWMYVEDLLRQKGNTI